MNSLLCISLMMLLTLFLSNADAVSSINTFPPTPDNIIATNYSGLVITANFTLNQVIWYYSGQCYWLIGSQRYQMFSRYCTNNIYSDVNITCSSKTVYPITEIHTNITLLDALHLTTLNISMVCSYFSINLPTKIVKDCPRFLGNDVSVNATSFKYGGKGFFQCSNYKKLFDSNGKLLDSLMTTCLFNAKWERDDDVECWGAPSTIYLNVLNKIFTEGEEATLSCSYWGRNFNGNKTVFFIGDRQYVLPRGERLKIQLQASDNNKLVSCQARNPFTMMFVTEGKSNVYQIKVIYPPFSQATNTTTCKWEEGKSESCSVEFMSNPTTNDLTLTKDGIPVLSSSEEKPFFHASGDLQTFTFRRRKVLPSDAGIYTLIIRSKSYPGTTLNVTFLVQVSNNPIALITATTIPAVIILVLSILTGIFCYCRKKRNSSPKIQQCKSQQVQNITQNRQETANFYQDVRNQGVASIQLDTLQPNINQVDDEEYYSNIDYTNFSNPYRNHQFGSSR